MSGLRRCRRGERGATLVEYALGVSFIGVAMMMGLGGLTGEATDELGDRGDSIGYPTEAPSGVDPTPSGPLVPEEGVEDPEETPPYTGVIEGSCTGPTSDIQDHCTFTLNPTPAPELAVVWAIHPNVGYTGVPPDVTFTSRQTRTIQATVGGVTTLSRTVACTRQGASSNLKCTIS